LSANVPPEGIGFTVGTPEPKWLDFAPCISMWKMRAAEVACLPTGSISVSGLDLRNHAVSEAIDVRTSSAFEVIDSSPSPWNRLGERKRLSALSMSSKHRYSREIKKLSTGRVFTEWGFVDRGLAAEPRILGPGF